MNPMSNIKGTQRINQRELELGLSGSRNSWHHKYKDSAWIFMGGLPYDLTEGDILCVFSQYGEVMNINLARDGKTGKSKGFCFICYEDQQSTILAVDNFNGIKILGRTIRVDHVLDYKKPKEDETIDDVTRRIREQGCAPKTPSASEEEEEEEELPVPVKKIKKEKKKKKKKDKKKKKKKAKESEESSSSSSEDEKEQRKDGRNSDESHGVKKEKEDPGYDKYLHGSKNAGSGSRTSRDRFSRDVPVKRERSDSEDSAEDSRNNARDINNGRQWNKTKDYQQERDREGGRRDGRDRDDYRAQGGFDRDRERGEDGGRQRSEDRGRERGEDRGQERGGERGRERGNDRGREKGAERVRDRPYEEGRGRSDFRGRDSERGRESERGRDRQMEREKDRERSRDIDRGRDRQGDSDRGRGGRDYDRDRSGRR